MYPILLLIVLHLKIIIIHGQGKILKSRKNAGPKQFPYHALLINTTNSSSICSAAIINNQWLITAAHCLKGKNASEMVAYVGSVFVQSPVIKPYMARELIRHEDYGALKNKIEFNDKVRPIQLPKHDIKNYENLYGIISGYGVECTRKHPAEHLQYVIVRILDPDECQKKSEFINSRHICTSVQGGSICNKKGDFGGPLVIRNELVGIVSWTENECVRTNPDVLTRVYSYISWIENTIHRIDTLHGL